MIKIKKTPYAKVANVLAIIAITLGLVLAFASVAFPANVVAAIIELILGAGLFVSTLEFKKNATTS